MLTEYIQKALEKAVIRFLKTGHGLLKYQGLRGLGKCFHCGGMPP